MRQLLLLTDDNFLSEVLGTYVRRDGIEIVRVPTASEAACEIVGGAAGVLVDIAKRGLAGADVIGLSQRAARARIPLFVLSSQARRDLSEFAAVVRAADVISKSEQMTALAARLRLWMNGQLADDEEQVDGFAIPELAVASA